MTITVKDLRRAAMDSLARREHGTAELRQKLQRKFGSSVLAEELEQTLEQLQAESLLSDARFAECFIRAAINKGQGPLRIRQELARKGVADGLIAETLASSETDWFALAESVLRKKFPLAHESSIDARERARCMRFLQYRGFSMDHISAQFS